MLKPMSHYFDTQLDEHLAVAASAKHTLSADFCRLTAVCAGAIDCGGRLLLFGNGGSAADAQHIATEFSVRFKANRRALPALALTTDGPTLTAVGNDLGFDKIFARQIEAHGRAGDVAIGISTSGRSANVLLGLRRAREMNISPVGFSGGDGGEMVGLTDLLILAPSFTTARIQEIHHMLGQMLCGAVEIALGISSEGTDASCQSH